MIDSFLRCVKLREVKFSFEGLEVWQKSVEFARRVLNLSENIQTSQKHFRLIEQLEAACTSVSLNIAEGKAKGLADAIVIQGFIDSYDLKIIEVKDKFIKTLRQKIKKILAKGDESVLALAIQENAEWIITNDDGLGKIAMVLGFKVKATPDLLLKALEKKLFDVCKLEILMRELVVENRLSYKVAELYIIEAKNYVKK